MKIIKQLITKIKENSMEYYTLFLIVFGLPLVAIIYVDIRLAISVLIFTQIVIGIFALRGNR